MSAVTHGLDPVAVRTIAADLGAAAGQLEQIAGDASALVGALAWEGADVEHFRGEWTSAGRPQLTSGADQLRRVAQDLLVQVDQQDAASGSGLPGLPSLLGGGPFATGGPGQFGGGDSDDGGFLGWLGDRAGDLWDGLTDAGETVVDGVEGGLDWLGGVAEGGMGLLGDGVNWLGDRVGDGLSWLGGGIEWGTDRVSDVIGGISSFGGWALSGLGLDGAGEWLDAAGHRLGAGIESFGDAMPRLGDSIGGLFHAVGTPLSQGRLPSISELVAGGALVLGNAGGAVANAATGQDLHVFDDGSPSVGAPHPAAGQVTRPQDLGDLVHGVIDADSAKSDTQGNIRITSVTHDGQTSYVVSVPGTAEWSPATAGQTPLDLTGNLVPMSGGSSTAMQDVQLAMQAAGIPSDAPVMLVGHSQGGIITSHLASDPSFMSQYNVTSMMTYGSPIDTSHIDPRVSTLALQHATDPVPRLDLGGYSMPAPGVLVPGPDQPGVTTLTLHDVDGAGAGFDQHGGALYERSLDHPSAAEAQVLQQYRQQFSGFLAQDGDQVSAVDVPIGRTVKDD